MFKRVLLSVAVGWVGGIAAGCNPADSNTAGDAGISGADAGESASDAGEAPMPIPEKADLETLLSSLRSDRDGAMLQQSLQQGWPAPVVGGYLFVSTDALPLVAGDHDNWSGTALTAESNFTWVVLPVEDGNHYKFTDGGDTWDADAWSRSYQWDEFGEMSTVAPAAAHLERFFRLGTSELAARTVRVWVPATAASHLLYAHDGQNLFNPNGPYGGWRMNDVAPAQLMIVGIDATDDRTWEYTHATETFPGGTVGGGADTYGAFIQDVIRPLVRRHYGEPNKVGVIGSSFGGIMSLHMADTYPGEFDFVASLSGTLEWGSRVGTGTDTLINRYKAAGHRDTPIYIDSGGNGGTCVDDDGDGTNDDDPTDSDAYCVNVQFRDALVDAGYEEGTDLWYHWAADAQHNEEAWAARVARPFEIFMGL